MRASETQELPDTLPATDVEVQNTLKGSGKQDKGAGKKDKGKHKKGKEAKGKKAQKSKKSKKSKVLKKNKTSKGLKPKGKPSKVSTKKDRPARRDLGKEFDIAASTEQVPATQPEKSSEEEGDARPHRPHASLVGYVYFAANNKWELQLQELMTGEDYKKCIVDAGGCILFFENENYKLNHVPHRTQFPLRVFREPVQAQAHAMRRAAEQIEAKAKEEEDMKLKQADKKKAEDKKIAETVAQELQQIEKSAEAAAQLAEQRAAAKKSEEEAKQRELIAQELEKAMAERKKAEEQKAEAEQKRLEEEAKMRAKQQVAEEELKKDSEARQIAEDMAHVVQQQLKEKQQEAQKAEKEEAARKLAEQKKAKEDEMALRVAKQLAEQTFADGAERDAKIIDLVQKAKEFMAMGEAKEEGKQKELQGKVVEDLLLRPATMDLATPPATPTHMPAPSESEAVPNTTLPPGEAEAEKLKAAAMERAKKRNAQWGRFMRTFASGGPKISIKHRASKKQVMPSVDILSFYSQFHRLWH